MFPARFFPERYFAPRYWPKVGGVQVNLIPNFIFVEPTRPLLFLVIAQPYPLPPSYPQVSVTPLGELGIDIYGTGEQIVAAWDGKLVPEIAAGGTMLANPVPTIQQQARTDGEPALSFTNVQISGTRVQAVVSVSGGHAGTVYHTLAKVYINNASTWRHIYGDIMLIGLH